MLLERAEGVPPPDSGDRRSFPEVKFAETQGTMCHLKAIWRAMPRKHQVESIQIVHQSEVKLLHSDVTSGYLTTALI